MKFIKLTKPGIFTCIKIRQQSFALLLARNISGLLALLAVLVSSATIVFPQTSWTKYRENPILELGPTGSWDSQSAEAGSVLFDGNTYHMWYAGNDGANYRIGHATSLDGIAWTKDTLNPVLDLGLSGSWEDHYVYVPCVLHNGTIFHMWYDGNNGSIERIGHATSPDGSNWKKDTLNPVLDVGSSESWEESEIFPMAGSVIYDDTIYHMWYGGGSYSTGIYATGYATSPDGSTWTKDTLHNPVMTISPENWDSQGVIPGTVLFDGTSYQVWYSGCSGDYRWRVGYATSTNGIDWIKDTLNNPVLDFGPSGSWDFMKAWNGSVLFDSIAQTYMMWYTGGASFAGRMGYATCLITGVDENTISNLYQRFALLQNYPNPFTTSTTIAYELQQPATVQITIYNHLGKQVAAFALGHKGQGKHLFSWQPRNLQAGVYYCVLRTAYGMETVKMVKMK